MLTSQHTQMYLSKASEGQILAFPLTAADSSLNVNSQTGGCTGVFWPTVGVRANAGLAEEVRTAGLALGLAKRRGVTSLPPRDPLLGCGPPGKGEPSGVANALKGEGLNRPVCVDGGVTFPLLQQQVRCQKMQSWPWEL